MSNKKAGLQNIRSFRAFLSYSSMDMKTAVWLHRQLESWKTPRELVGKAGTYGPIPAQLKPVFRDRDDARTSENIEQFIQDHLEDSDQLIVLCSPLSADANSWTNREIEWFIQLRPDGPIHAVIAAGSPPDCFPPALLEHCKPLAADIRPKSLGGKEGNRRAFIKLVAGLLGSSFDNLWQRDCRRRRIHYVTWIAGILTTLCGLIASINFQVTEAKADRYLKLSFLAFEHARYDLAALAAAQAMQIAPYWGSSTRKAAENQFFRLRGRTVPIGFYPHSRGVTDALIDPISKRVFTTSLDGRVRSWITEFADKQESGNPVLYRFNGVARQLEIASNSQLILARSDSGKVILFNPSSTAIEKIYFPDEKASAATFSKDGENLLIGTDKGNIRARNKNNKNWTLLARLSEPISHLSAGADNSLVAISGDRAAHTITSNGIKVLQETRPPDFFTSLKITDSGKRAIISSGQDIVWHDIFANDRIDNFTWKDLSPMEIAVSSDFHYGAAILTGYITTIWPISQPTTSTPLTLKSCPASTWLAPACQATALVFKPGTENHLYVGYADGTIRVWTPQGELLREIHGHVARITKLSFTSTPNLLLSASEDHTARLWLLLNKDSKNSNPTSFCQLVSNNLRSTIELNKSHLHMKINRTASTIKEESNLFNQWAEVGPNFDCPGLQQKFQIKNVD